MCGFTRPRNPVHPPYPPPGFLPSTLWKRPSLQQPEPSRRCRSGRDQASESVRATPRAVSTLLKVDSTRDGGLRTASPSRCSGASALISTEGRRLRQRGTIWKCLVPTASMSYSAAKKRAAELRDEGGRARLDARSTPMGCARTRRILTVSVRFRPFLRHFQQQQRPSSTFDIEGKPR
jgi:hypothetical protein